MFYSLTAMERITNIKGIYSSPIPARGILLPVVRGSAYLDSYSKRALDVAMAIVALALLAVLLPLIALLIKTTSRGPVFYIQDRIGRYGTTFKMLKFRTMHMDFGIQDKDRQTPAPDSKITIVGRCLRKVYLDEFPQFWNVLMGDMSVVGPRPEAPSLQVRMAFTVPRPDGTGEPERIDKVSRHRLIAKPGITGYAQIKAPNQRCHLVRSGTTHVSWGLTRLKYDMLYVYSCSLIMDIRIIVRTILRICCWNGV